MYLNDKFYVLVENKMICMYYFEMDLLEKVRKILFEFNLIYFYYINIDDDNNVVSNLNFLKEKIDDILYW